MDKTYRTYLYGRTSSDDDNTRSIETQQFRLRHWATSDPMVDPSHIREFWDADVSGTIPLGERPGGQRMLEAIASGDYNSIAVVYANRFARNLLSGLQAAAGLEKQGVKLVTIDEGWDARKENDPFFFQVRLLFADAEWRRIVKRLTDGQTRAMLRDQAPPGGPLTFGYRLDEHGRFVIWPEQAAIVIEIFERYLARACRQGRGNWGGVG